MSVDGKPNQPPRGELSREEREALERRSGELGRKLEAARQTSSSSRSGTAASGKGQAMAKALKVSAELIGGIVAGGAIGWYLDAWLHTKPWLFLLFFLLGTAAGMLNVVRAAMREKTPPLPSAKDDKDETS